MKRLKTLLPPRYRTVYIALALAIFILVCCDLKYLIIAIPFTIYIVQFHKDIILYIGIVLLIYGLSLTLYQVNTLDDTGQYVCKVKRVSYIQDYRKVYARCNRVSVNIYLSDGEPLLIGSTYKFTGELEHPKSESIPNTFNYKNYLKSSNTKYIISATKQELVKKGVSIYIIEDKVRSYIDSWFPKSSKYIKTFILADRSSIDQTMKNNINSIGISHMFAVSGYHVGILVIGIKWLLTKLRVKDKQITDITVIILVLYMIITSFSASVVRASLLFILLLVNKRIGNKYSVLDILTMIFILLLWIRPYYYYNVGFVLSFGITFSLLLSQRILKNRIGLHAVILVSIIAFLVSFPIVMNMNYQINLLTPIFNIIYVMIMTVIVIPFTYITAFLPVFDSPLYTLNKALEATIEYASKVNVFTVKSYFSNNWYIIIIYIIIVYIISDFERKSIQYRAILLAALIVYVSIISNKLDPRLQLVMIDVYGDSIFIKAPYDRCNVLIDTGEVDEYDAVIRYLQSMHVKRLDYIIISHFHTDHYGEINDIMSSFKTAEVVTNLNVKNYENQTITCGNIEFFIYPLSYGHHNENNNSIILSLYAGSKHYLFTGDAELEREEEFVSLYDIDVDYLKAGHHGSITSSSEMFLDAIQPEEVLISAQLDNPHGHPNNAIIDRFMERGIIIHRTDYHGTIEITYLWGKERKKYHRP